MAPMTLWQHNDVQMFEADTILFRESQSKKKDITVKEKFSVQI